MQPIILHTAHTQIALGIRYRQSLLRCLRLFGQTFSPSGAFLPALGSGFGVNGRSGAGRFVTTIIEVSFT